MRLAILSLALLSTACTSIEDQDWTTSRFKSAGAGGISHDLSDAVEASLNDTVGTVHFVAGLDNGAKAFAALGSDVDVGPALSGTATATLTGTWGVVGIENIDVTETGSGEGFITGRTFADGGALTLVVDMGAGTLTGASGELTVDGTVAGGDIGGDVRYRSVTGALDGVVGTLGAAGAFHGNDDDIVYSGGFVAD